MKSFFILHSFIIPKHLGEPQFVTEVPAQVNIYWILVHTHIYIQKTTEPNLFTKNFPRATNINSPFYVNRLLSIDLMTKTRKRSTQGFCTFLERV